MKRFLKWVGITIGSLIGLALIVTMGFAFYANQGFKANISSPHLIPINADMTRENIERGEYLVKNVMACADCHGVEYGQEPLSGRYEQANMGPISATIAFPNLTSDVETGLGGWTDAEIARAIREGVDKDGVELVLMPSGNYGVLSDKDVAAIIAYLRTLDPVHNEIPPFSANIPGKMMMVSGIIPFPPKGKPLSGAVNDVQPGTLEYGTYLVSLAGCRDCHGPDFSGAPLPGADPGEPGAPNIAAGSYAASWTETEFVQTFRTGVTPANRPLDPEKMPINAYKNISDADLKAIYMYLQSINHDTDK